MGQADHRHIRQAVDANVYAGLRLATLVIGGLLTFFVFADILTTPAPWAPQVAMVDALAAGAFFTAYYLIRRGVLEPHHAHPTAGVLALIVAAGTLHDTYVLGDPEQTTYLILIVLGAGSIFLSHRWLYAVAGFTMVGWIGVAAQRPDIVWTTFGFALFAACVLSVLVHTMRHNAFQRMEAMRLAEAGRKEQLEIRESALESAVRALQESEERYKRLVEGAPDGFLVIAGARILYANPTAIRMFGAKSSAELEGIDPIRLVHEEHSDLVRKRVALVEAGTTTEPAEIKCVRLDGTTFDVEVIGQPITFLGQPADQTVIRDITDRKRAESERNVARERLAEIRRLKEMDRVKTQFVNTISHELRTPLTPIKVQLHIMKGAKDAAAMMKARDVLERNVGRLAGLVDELLEVARIQAGTLRLAKTYVDLGQAVQQALDSYVDVARSNQLELSQKVEDGLITLADAKRLQQVMYNLLGNAFKFTEAGGRIDVVVRRDGDNALVSVSDDGAGMEAEDIARLFEPFSQVHDPMQKTNAGTGLGLYICRGIVEGHGGKIWAESDGRGKGSRFVFTIPLETPTATVPTA